MSKLNYAKKLKDPRWQKKRLEIMDRDGFKCHQCGDGESTLNVHHIKYEGDNPWDTSDQWMKTLCEKCHKIAHLDNEIKEFWTLYHIGQMDYGWEDFSDNNIERCNAATKAATDYIVSWAKKVDHEITYLKIVYVPFDYCTNEYLLFKVENGGETFVFMPAGTPSYYEWDRHHNEQIKYKGFNCVQDRISMPA